MKDLDFVRVGDRRTAMTTRGTYLVMKSGKRSFFARFKDDETDETVWLQHKGLLREAIAKCNRHHRAISRGKPFLG